MRPEPNRLRKYIFIAIILGLSIQFLLEYVLISGAAASTEVMRVQEAQQAEFFEKRIRPVLMRNCSGCHNPKAQVAGLDLTTAEGFLRGGESGPIFNKERPEQSRILQVIGYEGKLKMPPKGKLKEDEIADIAEWVRMGAPWPGAAPVAAVSEPGKWVGRSTVREFTEQEKKYWAFQSLTHPEVPKVKDQSWVRSPIDGFILSKLEGQNIKPASPAGKETLLRRATFDLTGMPPTEAEIRDFLADDSPDAFKKVVERLLASPRYGEKWGRNWLDVARYADSTGNDEDHRYPYAWKYRDYVIESFNKDLPYDQFVREQIAGDVLPPPNSEGINRRGIIATGFLALGPKAIAQQDKKKMLYDVYDEQVDVTSKAFLGLTISCARCHNHKFDPILTKDYYSMVGIFASTKSFSDPKPLVSQVYYKPLVTKEEYDRYLEKRKTHQKLVRKEQLAIGEIIDTAREQLLATQIGRVAEYMIAARAVYQDKADPASVSREKQLDPEILRRWVEYLKPGRVRLHLLEWDKADPSNLKTVADKYQAQFNERYAQWVKVLNEWREKYRESVATNKEASAKPEFDAGKDRFFHEVLFPKGGPFAVSQDDKARFSETELKNLTELKKKLDELKAQAPQEPEMACAVEDGEIADQKVFIRGDYHNEGEDAPKAFPQIVISSPGGPPQPQISSGSGRLQLANWIADGANPLTPRVMVNRIWQGHFGEGIVRTPDNFGKMGERPSHPELLDFLAWKFIESGWSVKTMHRMIMLSNAYQMSSQADEAAFSADSENRLLSRFNRRRLTVEEMRDALLAIDGSLDLTVGGTLQSGLGTDGENDNKRLSMNPEQLNRRTVYLPLRRANLPSLLNLFDFGDATTASGKRQLTNVATQALFWMNSEFVTERSNNFVRSLMADKNANDESRVKAAYRRIANREAMPEEVSSALKYIADFSRKFSGEQSINKAWSSFCRALMASNNFIYVD